MPTADRRRLGSVLGAAALLVAACSGPAEEPAGFDTASLTPEPTEERTPTHTPPEEPALDLELPPGLVIEEVPDLSGSELAALETFVRFQAEHWRSLIDNELSPQVAELAAPDVAAMVADQVDVQVREDFRLGGTLSLTPQVDGATTDIAVVTACFDQSGVTVIEDGKEEVGEDAAANPVFSATADLANRGDRWVVTSYRLEFEPC